MGPRTGARGGRRPADRAVRRVWVPGTGHRDSVRQASARSGRGQDTLMTAPRAEITVPIGVYRPGTSIANIEAYESFLGMPPGTTVSYVLDFMLDQATWAQFEAAALQNTANSSDSSATATTWAGQLGGRTLMLGTPACVQATTGADEAAGDNDAHWRALGTTLIGAGLGNAVLRIGREFNGGWYPWKVTEGGQSAYIAGYSHV